MSLLCLSPFNKVCKRVLLPTCAFCKPAHPYTRVHMRARGKAAKWAPLTQLDMDQMSSVSNIFSCLQPDLLPTNLAAHKIGSSPACNFPAVVGDHPHLQTERNYPPQRPVGCLGPGWCTYQNRGPPLCSLCHKAHDDSQRIPEICVVPWHVLPDSIPQGCLGEPRHGHVARRHC